jgi:hypothetical protein
LRLSPIASANSPIPEGIQAIQPFDAAVNGEVKIITIDDSSRIKPLFAVLENMHGELLVLGMHKKKGISGWFGKNITEDVVSKAHSDGLVVKHKEEDRLYQNRNDTRVR